MILKNKILFFLTVVLGVILTFSIIQARSTPQKQIKTNFSLSKLSSSTNTFIITYKDTDKVKTFTSSDKKLIKAPIVISKLTKSKVSTLLKDPSIKSIELDQTITLPKPIISSSIKPSASQTQDWGISKIKAPAAWANGYTGKGVKIAVLDSGVGPHSDVIVSGGTSFIGGTYNNDVFGHGTHVAGIISAENNSNGTIGAAYDSDIYSVKVLDDTGGTYTSTVIQGIDWAINNKMDIITMSLSFPSYSQALYDITKKAYDSGILLVGSAGNTGTLTTRYPSGYDTVISVGATTSSNTIASFSTYGPTVEMSAPGSSVYSTYKNNSYAYMSGTSMATPYVTAALAIMKQENPTFTNIQLRTLLQKSILDLGTTGRDDYFGFGLVQVPSEPITTDYLINLSKFNINNQKQNPVETTKGINDALVWAKSNGYSSATLPSGEYLISKDSNINMVGDFTFNFAPNAIIYKETNNYQSYVTVKISYPNNNVTINGGKFVGDKNTHDFSSGGLHEGGAGIVIAGSKNVTLQNVETSNFTGDGISTGGVFTFIRWFSSTDFENGTLNTSGAPINDTNYIRTKDFIDVTDPKIKEKGAFSLELQENMKDIFYDTYFYDANNNFISTVSNTRYKYQDTPVPTNATKAKLVFKQSNLITRLGMYAHITGENILIDNVYSHDNRRQGLTIGGASNKVIVQNSRFENIAGTAPQAGIDIEGENMGISTIVIKNNTFTNNGRNIVVADGGWIDIYDNILNATTYAASLIVWERAYNVNTYRNTLNDSGVYLRGGTTTLKDTTIKTVKATNIDNIIFDQGVTLDNVQLFNAGIRVFANDNPAVPTLGAIINNTTLTLDNNFKSSYPFYVIGKVLSTNLTINGHGSLGSIVMPNGLNPDGTTFTNLKVLNMDPEYGAALVKGSYKDSLFEVENTTRMGVGGVTISTGTTFENTTFKLSSPFRIQHRNSSTDDTVISNSTFTFVNNISSMGGSRPVILQEAGGNVYIKDSTFTTLAQTSNLPIISIGFPLYNQGDNKLKTVYFNRNTINSNFKTAIGIEVLKGENTLNKAAHEITNNTLYNATLKLSPNDLNQGNTLLTK